MQVCAWWLRLFWTLWNCMIWISLRTKGTNIGLDFRYNIACFCLSCISSVDLQKANALMCVYRCWLHLDTHTHTQIHTPSYHIHTCMHIKRKAFCWTSMQMEPVEVNLISPSCAKWQTHPLPYKLQGATTVENSSFWNTIYIYIYVRCPCYILCSFQSPACIGACVSCFWSLLSVCHFTGIPLVPFVLKLMFNMFYYESTVRWYKCWNGSDRCR